MSYAPGMAIAPAQTDRRLLLVHAHPDDETIGTGASMAKYAAEGVAVSLVTCTLGEEGEVLVSEKAHLAAHESDQLGQHRQLELAEAMGCLAVTDWRLLGGPGRFRDSGMMGTASNDRDDCFWRADLLVAATELVPVIRSLRPHVLVTYDDFGGYGHPDHIQAHRCAMYAAQLAAAATFRPELGAAWDIPKIYWTALPKSMMRRGIQALRDAGETSGIAGIDPEQLPFGVDDHLVTTVVDGRAYLDQKIAAMHAYPTQIDMASGFFSLAASPGREMGLEHFRLVKGHPGGPADADGRETDLFAGLNLTGDEAAG